MRDNQLNQEALNNPQPGDYWHEMFCPYFMVVNVDGPNITVLSCLGGPNSYSRKHELNASVDNGDGTWSFDYSKSMVVDREWIRRAVTYETIDGFVADVVRGGNKYSAVVKEWENYNIQRLIDELNKFGSKVTEHLLKKVELTADTQ
jgi:hypothetical protein